MDRSFQIHLLQMSDGTPHPEATCPIIPGPVFPPDTHTVEGELQVTGFRLAVRVLLLEPPAKSERLIVWDWRTGEKYMVCRSCLLLPQGGSILPFRLNPQEILYLAHRVRAKFIDDYHLLTTAAAWVTTPRLWDTTILAETLKTCTIEFGLGPDYKIDTTLGNPFYFNMESSHGVPFHEDTSKQLIGIRVVPRACSRPCSTLLLIRYGDLMKLASQIGKKPWIKWEAWRKFTLPVKFRPGVQEFGLLRSHLLIVCRDSKGSGTILYIYDFTVRSLRQRVQDKKVSDQLIPYTRRKFPLSAEGEPLGDFRFTEDNIFVLSVGTLPIRITRDLTYVIPRVLWTDPRCYGCGQFRGGGSVRPTFLLYPLETSLKFDVTFHACGPMLEIPSHDSIA